MRNLWIIFTALIFVNRTSNSDHGRPFTFSLLDTQICMFSCIFYFKLCFESSEFSNILELKKSLKITENPDSL